MFPQSWLFILKKKNYSQSKATISYSPGKTVLYVSFLMFQLMLLLLSLKQTTAYFFVHKFCSFCKFLCSRILLILQISLFTNFAHFANFFVHKFCSLIYNLFALGIFTSTLCSVVWLSTSIDKFWNSSCSVLEVCDSEKWSENDLYKT